MRTAIYWHFGSKEGLLVPVIERVASAWIDEIQSAVYREGDPLARLDRFVAGLRDLVVERPHMVRLLIAVALERSDHDAGHARRPARDLRARARRHREGHRRLARRALARVRADRAHRAGLRRRTRSRTSSIDPRPGEVERVFAELRTAILLMIGARLRERLDVAPTSEGDPHDDVRATPSRTSFRRTSAPTVPALADDAAYRSLIERLSRQSVAKHYDAYADIPWDDPACAIDPADPRWELPASDPLGATRLVPVAAAAGSGRASASS